MSLDEDYKTISNLNDNAYLTNIKSIRYLETDNYRRLLSFVDSAPYQIYIMGHSCGNSDRTLLNTLFEHRNCVSIKPYYHLKEDGTDNYIEIIQNISRNFNDMQAHARSGRKQVLLPAARACRSPTIEYRQ